MPGCRHVVPTSQEREYQLPRVIGSPRKASDRASCVASNGLASSVDGDAAPVKGEVCTLELHARVGTIVPAVIQDNAGALPQSVRVLRLEPKLQDRHDDGRRNWGAH